MQSCYIWIKVWKDRQSGRHSANEGFEKEIYVFETLELTI